MEVLLPESVRHQHTHLRERYLRQPQSRPMGQDRRVQARRKDGTTFPVEVGLSTIDTESGPVVCASVSDITERVAAQRAIADLNTELRGLNEALEQRVAERTAQLEAQARQLRAANEELESFSYSVSHDLRAPLRAIAGFARILARGYGPVLDEAGQRYLAKVDAGAVQMGQLIDGLLAFSRVQRLAVTSQPVDLAGLVDSVWEDLAEQRRGREITLRCDRLPRLHGDPRLIRHVVLNLLENAVKYTRTRAAAEVHVGYRGGTGGAGTFFVADNGAGFDMRYAGKLFQVFQRLHRAEDYEGTGIGLALAARIVHRHGGRIWAESAPDRGATFFVTLPTAPTA